MPFILSALYSVVLQVSNYTHLQSAILQPLPGARLESLKVKKHIKVLHKAFTVSRNCVAQGGGS